MAEKELTREQAIALVESGWWKEKSAEEIVRFQLFTERLCMPFHLFHEALESALGRSVWTHELGLNVEGIKKEFLKEQAAPSFEEILSLIPQDKLIVLALEG